MSKLTYKIEAGKSVTLSRGTFFKINIASSPVDVVIVNSNGESENFVGLVSGDWFEPSVGFDKIVVTAVVDGSYTFTTVNGKAGNSEYPRLGGDNEIEHYAYIDTVAVNASQYGNCQLYNPVGSSVILAIDSIFLKSGNDLRCGVINSQVGAQTDVVANNAIGRRDSKCLKKNGVDVPTILNTDTTNLYLTSKSSFVNDGKQLKSPLLIPEGYGLICEHLTVNVTATVEIEFSEIG